MAEGAFWPRPQVAGPRPTLAEPADGYKPGAGTESRPGRAPREDSGPGSNPVAGSRACSWTGTAVVPATASCPVRHAETILACSTVPPLPGGESSPRCTAYRRFAHAHRQAVAGLRGHDPRAPAVAARAVLRRLLVQLSRWPPVDLHKQLRRGFRRTAFLNESKAGRESADIKELLPGLRRLLSSYRFTALLVSMGGNDVVGGELAEYVKPADEPQSPYDPRWGVVPASVRDHIRLSAFEQALRYVGRGPSSASSMRATRWPPLARSWVHNYDHVFPSGKSFKLLGRKAGPWIKPYLDGVGLTDPLRQREACAWLIDQFTRMLDALVTQTPRMRLVDGRGTLRHAGEMGQRDPSQGTGVPQAGAVALAAGAGRAAALTSAITPRPAPDRARLRAAASPPRCRSARCRSRPSSRPRPTTACRPGACRR